MARKRSPEPAPQPASKEVCPICRRHNCQFFLSCRKIKLDEDPAVSGKKRSELFRQYHADICQTCRNDVKVCHENKVAAVIRAAKKEAIYLTDEQVRAEVECTPCAPPKQGFRAVMPTWYVPGVEMNVKG